MSDKILNCDYLVVGSGAVGMAFVDTLLSETGANIIMVDRYAAPGGHWNMAYPFVTLHQPSQFYGVSSKELSTGEKDQAGLNAGLYDLASGAQVKAYFDSVMRHTFLPSGRVKYFPMCNYTGSGEFEQILSGDKYKVTYKKSVDATYLKTSVPSTHTPGFEIDDGVQFMPLNDLPRLETAPDGYVIIGGGKTGIDACLWLLGMGVSPDDMTWIVSRDAWLLNRANTQPGAEFFENTMGAQAGQFEAIANATSFDDMYDRLEACGYFLRLDTNVRPTMFHGATISEAELTQLRRIKNIVRMGRVTRVSKTQINLTAGSVPTTPAALHIDCSASAISNLETKPVFNGNTITPQTVRSYQPVFSAAFIAHIEAAYETEDEKNKLCGVVPLPNSTQDYLHMTAAMMMNQYAWGQDKNIRKWLRTNRLDGFSKMVAEVDKSDAQRMAIMGRLRDNAFPAMAKLQQFIAELA